MAQTRTTTSEDFPPFLRDADEPRREKLVQCLDYIQSWREYLGHTWLGTEPGLPDIGRIGEAVDHLVSLGLLVDFVRRSCPRGAATSERGHRLHQEPHAG